MRSANSERDRKMRASVMAASFFGEGVQVDPCGACRDDGGGDEGYPCLVVGTGG